MIDTRLIRQLGILNPSKDLDIHIVGLGSIGSWTALALSKMGYEKITLYDFDIVEEHNLATQFYDVVEDLNSRKAFALKKNLSHFSGIAATAIDSRPADIKGDVLIMAVDNMKSRYELAKLIPNFQFIVDARMGGEIGNVFALFSTEAKRYEGTLFSDEAGVQAPCSEKAIAYNVFGMAGIIGNIVKRMDKGERFPFETTIDYKNLKIYTEKF